MECKDLLMDDSCSKKITSTTHEDKDTVSEGCYIYRAGHPHPDRITWRPSIHMPKTAARIWLRVTISIHTPARGVTPKTYKKITSNTDKLSIINNISQLSHF